MRKREKNLHLLHGSPLLPSFVLRSFRFSSLWRFVAFRPKARSAHFKTSIQENFGKDLQRLSLVLLPESRRSYTPPSFSGHLRRGHCACNGQPHSDHLVRPTSSPLRSYPARPCLEAKKGTCSCCICGAGVLVFIGWAVSHRFVQPPEAKEPVAGDFNQAQYMREVRLRHQDQLAAIMGGVSALVGLLVLRC